MSAAGPALGIDVVDLEHPRSRGKSSDRRFIARVFGDAEAAVIGASDDPDRTLWTLWAAKEAAFKAATLLSGEAPVFRHGAFQVRLASDGRRGRVTYEDTCFDVRFQAPTGHLVAVAEYVGDRGPSGPALRHRVATVDAVMGDLGLVDPTLDDLRARLAPDEARSVHSVRSALARLALRRDVAGWLDLDEGDLAVVCAEGRAGRVPPRLHRRGRPLADVAVSISHDGRWLAWAAAISARSGDTGEAG